MSELSLLMYLMNEAFEGAGIEETNERQIDQDNPG